MTLEEFCVALASLDLSVVRQGAAVLWFLDDQSPGAEATPGEIARALRDAGITDPHSTRLGESLVKSGYVLKARGGRLKLKPAQRLPLRKKLGSILAPAVPKVDQDTGYLPKGLWNGTRGYIEKVATQINGCYHFEFYDGAAVLIRRLLETLLIHCYEHLTIEANIKGTDGNYRMLGEIIKCAVDKNELNLGRESKEFLREGKLIGDRSAHNPRYNAIKADLDTIRAKVRLTVEELLHISNLKK